MQNKLDAKLFTIKEAAEFVRVHPNTIRNLILRRELAACRIGKNIRIQEIELLKILTPYQGGEFGVWKNNNLGR
jgi:excisionase family DNA binding protein